MDTQLLEMGSTKEVSGMSGGPNYTCVSKKKRQVYLIDKLLQHLWKTLQPALRDISTTQPDGTPKASPAYTAFFKDSANIPFVRDLLTNITTGTSMLSGDFSYSVRGSPVFYSVTEPGEVSAKIKGKMIDMWDHYLQNPTATAAQLRHTPYIILFPYFWAADPPRMYGDVPPAPHGDSPASNCLTVNTVTNRFRLNDALHWGGNLIQYRMWLLMEELAHYYTTQSRGKTNDVQNANTLFWLSAKDSLETVQAYMYYAACIYGNCKDFPTHTRGVELLETGTGRWLNLLANETQEPLVAEILEVTDIQFHQ
ncbi:MAG: hypothetical protein L6R39_002520 [Caloplaca ligustica]|nr:MAG: hypothetical protein L6R39_002520 [Caloplaca ligustica]